MKTKLDQDPGVDVRYSSQLGALCDWIDTTNFVTIGARGVAKSTVILASRSERCVRLMPGAPFAIVANTYANLIDNIMPAVQNGWRLRGLIEGVHYVKGRRPPEEWVRRCSVIVDDYRHVYSFWNGCVIFLGSLDNPSLMAGKSVVHLFFDEAKYASDARAARTMPILRGDAITYGNCYLYGGVTITTDMPDVTEGEYDWFFRYASEMDPERILAIIQAAGELNRLLIKYDALTRSGSPDERKLARLEKKIEYYRNGLRKLRKGQTFFINISSFANIDVLTVEYAERLYNGALELHEFQKSVMGMKPGVRRDARFYPLFGDDHKYYDGTRSGEAAFSSRELVYLDPDRELDGGQDFGNMMSLVIGQSSGSGTYRVHKNFYELPPHWLRELADQFLEFFAGHRNKVLNLYYDRSGNSYQRQRKDFASDMKHEVEYDAAGRPTGWTVNLKSRKQKRLDQNEEYDFMIKLLGGKVRGLPKLLVDAVNCPELVCSVEGAKAEIKHKGDRKVVLKVKKSEKLPIKKLPRLSTNMSDAFKYLMMRKAFLKLTSSVPYVGASTAAASEWLESHLSDRS